MPRLVKTGIEGLDSMLYGGIPEGNEIILAGGPGSGKTLLAFEYLYRSAKEGITTIFFALEEDPDRLIENAKSAFTDFTDIDALVKSKKLVVGGEDLATAFRSAGESGSSYEFSKVVSDIESVVASSGAKRIVIDSLTVLDMLMNDPQIFRRSVLALVTKLRKLGVTAILTAELEMLERERLHLKSEFFLFDGIMMMYENVDDGKRALGLEILKMRGTKHSLVTVPYEITQSGVNVKAGEGKNV